MLVLTCQSIALGGSARRPRLHSVGCFVWVVNNNNSVMLWGMSLTVCFVMVAQVKTGALGMVGFGNRPIRHIAGKTVAQGSPLLERLPQALKEFKVTGGATRVWTKLAGCQLMPGSENSRICFLVSAQFLCM